MKVAVYEPARISSPGRVILYEVRDAPGEGGKLPPRVYDITSVLLKAPGFFINLFAASLLMRDFITILL